MPKAKQQKTAKWVAEWPLPAGATLGSSVRARGILLEIRARLPSTVKKALDIEGGTLSLKLPEDAHAEFMAASIVIETTLAQISDMPVIPREIEDILSISTTERHRWLKDGRLPSDGTRTVKLRGRAKKITFHVFSPRIVEDILNDDRVSEWREEDAVTAAENRRRAAWKAKLVRAQKAQDAQAPKKKSPDSANLVGWEEFEREGLLR